MTCSSGCPVATGERQPEDFLFYCRARRGPRPARSPPPKAAGAVSPSTNYTSATTDSLPTTP